MGTRSTIFVYFQSIWNQFIIRDIGGLNTRRTNTLHKIKL